jgi:hypothetical protein
MDANPAEIMAKPRLEEFASCCVQRSPRFAQHLVHDRRRLNAHRLRRCCRLHLQFLLILLLAVGALAADLRRRGGDGWRRARPPHDCVGDGVRLTLERIVDGADLELGLEHGRSSPTAVEHAQRRLISDRGAAFRLRASRGETGRPFRWGGCLRHEASALHASFSRENDRVSLIHVADQLFLHQCPCRPRSCLAPHPAWTWWIVPFSPQRRCAPSPPC